MANFRLLMDDAVATASITASSTAGTLVAANLKNNEPELVWRATGTSATLTLTWASAVPVGAVVLGWSNLTDSGTVSAALYTNTGDASPVATASATAETPLRLGSFVFGEDPLGVTAADLVGILSNVQVWFPSAHSVRKVVITISNPDNTENIQVGRLMVGPYHETHLNPAYGMTLTFIDKSEVQRTESGSIRFEPKRAHRRLSVSMTLANALDSVVMMKLGSYGRRMPVFVSVFPDDEHEFHNTHAFIAHVPSELSHTVSSFSWSAAGVIFEEIV